jgi:site-specific recombinase
MASVVGKIFGMPFDIRHITIAAGNASIGLYGANLDQVSISFLATVLLGVLGIGFFNFLVSFSLAFMVALRSRGLSMRHFPAFLGILWRYFKSRPLDFVRPRKRISG